MDSIKGLVDKEGLVEAIKINTDEYGKACFDIAIKVMKYLDGVKEFSIIGEDSPFEIISRFGGDNNYVAGSVVSIVVNCYKDGWKFYLAGIDPKMIHKRKFKKDMIKNVLGFVDEDTANEYLNGLEEKYTKKGEKDGKKKSR